MTWSLMAGVAAFAVVPLVLTFETSGTLTEAQAAGSDAEFMRLADIDVHVERAFYSGSDPGEHPVFILLHGFGASTFSWRDVIGPLSQDGDVIAYDRPGFGFTERPAEWATTNPYGVPGNVELLKELIDRVARGRDVILVGHSAGGQIAAEFALQHPDSVQGLVLVDAAIYTTGGLPGWLAWLYEVPQIKQLGPFLVQGIAKSGVGVLRESFYDASQVSDEVLAGYQRPLRVRNWEQALWEFTTAPRTNSVVANLKKIRQPTLVISGEFDTIVPVSDAKKLAQTIPNSTLRIVPQAAHLPQEEKSEEFVGLLRAWLPRFR